MFYLIQWFLFIHAKMCEEIFEVLTCRHRRNHKNNGGGLLGFLVVVKELNS